MMADVVTVTEVRRTPSGDVMSGPWLDALLSQEYLILDDLVVTRFAQASTRAFGKA